MNVIDQVLLAAAVLRLDLYVVIAIVLIFANKTSKYMKIKKFYYQFLLMSVLGVVGLLTVSLTLLLILSDNSS